MSAAPAPAPLCRGLGLGLGRPRSRNAPQSARGRRALRQHGRRYFGWRSRRGEARDSATSAGENRAGRCLVVPSRGRASSKLTFDRRSGPAAAFSSGDLQQRRPSARTTLRSSHRHLPRPAPQRMRGQPPNPASDNADDLVKPLHGSARYARRAASAASRNRTHTPGRYPHCRRGASAASDSEMSHEECVVRNL
jgi:hypothetical protein